MSSSLPLRDRVALITGASSGIGAATAKLFASQGAKLVLNGRNADRLEAVASAIRESGGEVVTVVGSVDKEETHIKLVETALNRFGALHIAFNNSGVFPFARLVDVKEEDIDSLLNINVKGVIWGLKHQIPAIAKSSTQDHWGVIINNSSVVSSRIKSGMSEGGSVYAASKAAVDKLTQIGALEARQHFIRVNSINPGVTTSEGVVDKLGGGDVEQVNKFANAHILSSHPAAPHEIAQTVLFLADNRTGRFFTGATIVQDGGFQCL